MVGCMGGGMDEWMDKWMDGVVHNFQRHRLYQIRLQMKGKERNG